MRAFPRTQSSIAVRGDDGPWFLVNASPDAREQLATLELDTGDVRSPPVAGVLLTDAEIDHTAGLLLLRESTSPLRIYGAAAVERALRKGFPVLEMLSRYSGVIWQTLEADEELALEGSSLAVSRFAVGGDPPLYADPADPIEASGLRFRDRRGGAVITYVPGVARRNADVLDRLGSSDLALVDGTFWRDDELARLGISTRTAADMGHVPLSGPDGTLVALAALERPRTVLVHINNTNPILLEDSPERAEVLAAGVAIGSDGQEFTL